MGFLWHSFPFCYGRMLFIQIKESGWGWDRNVGPSMQVSVTYLMFTQRRAPAKYAINVLYAPKSSLFPKLVLQTAKKKIVWISLWAITVKKGDDSKATVSFVCPENETVFDLWQGFKKNSV